MKPTLYKILFFLTVFVSCDSESLEEPFEDTPVVESYLFVANPVTVKVSRLTTMDSDAKYSDDDIDHLTLTLQYGNESIMLIPQGNGIYNGPANFLVAEDTEYTLKFFFNGKEVKATTKALSEPKDYTQSVTSIAIKGISGPPTPGSLPSFPDPVELSWSNPENDYYLVMVENMESDPTPIHDFGDREPPAISFREEPYQTSSTKINARRFQYYGKHRLILFHLRSEYASLYKDSGTSSQNITTPPTNVENGLGIFTAIHSDTLYLDVVPE